MGHFYRTRSLLSCIIICSVAIILSADGGSITWFEPPPFETETDDSSISAANNKSVVKGSFNEELSCNFSLSADLRINTVFMKFDGTNVAIFAPGQQAPTVVPGFANRFNATWVPNQLTLIMLSVTDATEGEYRCEVLSLGGSIQTWSRTIHVSVLVPPSINEITGKDVTEGENVTLKCSADGKPTPNIEWMRLPDNIVVLMPLIDINRHDLKKYRCTADNGVGTPATRDVTIDVKYPVEAIGVGGNSTMAEAGVKNVSCPVDGNPQPSITWYKGSEVGGSKISSEKQLTVKVNSGENVCYSCLANNSLGTVTITQCLIVQEPSTAPTYPTSAPVGPPGTVIGIVAGVVVAMAIVIIGLVAWWVHKKRKSRNTKQGKMQYLEAENKDSLLEKTHEA